MNSLRRYACRAFSNKSAVASILLATPFVASANIIWPSLFIVEQYYVWYVILAGLVIETIAARLFLKTSLLKSFFMMIVTNLISGLLGYILIPVSGLLTELLMFPCGTGTFSIFNWILDYLFAIAANTLVEGLALKLIFKYPLKHNLLWLFGANAISIIICIFVPVRPY